MNSEAMASPEMTRAAERYLEQYGDPMVMNTYLRSLFLPCRPWPWHSPAWCTKAIRLWHQQSP